MEGKSSGSILVNRWTVVPYTIIIMIGLYLAADFAGRRIYEMIYERGLIPHIILIASAFALGLLCYKYVQTRLSQRHLSRVISFVHDNIDQILVSVQSNATRPEQDSAEPELFESLPQGRERDRIVGLLRDTREAGQEFAFKRLEMFLDLEAQASEDSFKVPQVLAWTVPMLGFLGTVWGISLSLGNFTGVMGDVDNIAKIKAGLGTITAGLSIAFDTTLLGLFFAIVITGCMTVLQRHESSCLDRLERTALDVLKTLSSHESSRITDIGDGRKALTQAASELRDALGALRSHVAELGQIAVEQSKNLAEERKALESAANAIGRLSNFADSLDNFSDASRELRRAVGTLENPREFRLIQQNPAKREDPKDE